jgi:hypothetical protein
MWTLLFAGTFLDNLGPVMDEISDSQGEKDGSIVFGCLFCSFVALSALMVMNMLIGVLCEVISAVAEEEKEGMMIDTVHDKFEKIVHQLDKNSDGTLSWDEFQALLDIPEALTALESVSVDPVTMVDMAEDLFFEDGEHEPLQFEEFMDMVLDLRGGQEASVENIMMLGKRFNRKFLNLTQRMDTFEGVLHSMDDKVSELLRRKASGWTPLSTGSETC